MSTAPAPRPARVTAAAVARLADTSVATVSLVANGKTAGRVSPAIAARVEAAIAELGYVVDQAARSLASGASSLVIFIAPDIANPFYARVLAGIQSSLGPEFQLMLTVTEGGRAPETSDITRLAGLRPAGFLVGAPSAALVRALPSGIPAVLLDAPGMDPAAATVNLDLSSGVDEILGHLAENGHRAIGYLDGLTDTATFRLRRDLLTTRAASHGLKILTDARARSQISLAAAATAMENIWPRWRTEGVSAVICATDNQAYGVLAAAKSLKFRVGTDLAVIGFDNLPTSEISDPALSSVSLPGYELGEAAATRLRHLITGTPPARPAVAELPTRLIVRRSSKFSINRSVIVSD